jgi:hypothetical protein
LNLTIASKHPIFLLGECIHQKRCDRLFTEIGEFAMREEIISTEVGRKYSKAYDAQYTTKDIHKAFTLYADIIAAYPDTEEAGYSRSQVQIIVNAVVPKKKIMDSLLELARIHFEQNVPLDAEPASA